MWSRPDTPGQYAFFNATTCPAGWIAANGTNGTVDLRGEFIRGWDNGRGADPSRALASWEADDFKSHNHVEGHTGYGSGLNQMQQGGGSLPWTPSVLGTGFTGGTETRPRNVALLACMKR